MTLPECPFCDADNTLTPVASDGKGVIVAECSCCSRRCRVNAEGVIVWPVKVETDVSGNLIDGP